MKRERRRDKAWEKLMKSTKEIKIESEREIENQRRIKGQCNKTRKRQRQRSRNKTNFTDPSCRTRQS